MLSVLLLSIGITAQAQQAITATGRDASGSGGSISYSAGQVVYTTNTDTSGRVSEGVQQPYEFFILGTKETESNISLLVFPNPTADNLTLKISDYNNEKLSYQLFDMQGKLLNKGPVRAQQTPIDTSNLLPATYFIYVVNQDNKYVQSFKIIKN
ncbi:hypothetical protein C9994_03000 [Marivirga lumbricoides]|uniref:Secretion system C-terminal sorting domain-containing protein n=1 Tax=Marivirga lumbricoides TaxID=1046115 RepID=A0A2T4DUC0_9BACT|nr:hypothetical protein C9994_03000 [Marivirga lumbricoides]